MEDGVIYIPLLGGGLGISSDGGQSYTVLPAGSNGMPTLPIGDAPFMMDTDGDNIAISVFGPNSAIGLIISNDGGATFSTKSMTDGLGSNLIFDVFVNGSTFVAIGSSGVSISLDNGASFTPSYSFSDGLASGFQVSSYIDANNVLVGGNGGYAIGDPDCFLDIATPSSEELPALPRGLLLSFSLVILAGSIFMIRKF